jgi:hypothetical protein
LFAPKKNSQERKQQVIVDEKVASGHKEAEPTETNVDDGFVIQGRTRSKDAKTMKSTHNEKDSSQGMPYSYQLKYQNPIF